MQENTDIINNYINEEELYPHVTSLIREFKNDPLYSLLKSAGYEELIITDKMRKELYIGRNYSVEEAASITDTEAISIRNLLNGANSDIMPNYLQCEKEKKFWHIPAQTVFKIRMVFLIKGKIKSYSWNQIASIGIGKTQPFISEILNPAEEKALLEKQVELLEQKNETLEKTMNYIISGKLITELERAIAEKFDNIEKTNKTLLEDNNCKVQNMSELIEDKYNEMNHMMEMRFMELRYNENRKRAEADWMAKWFSERSLVDRLLNKQPNEIEKRKGIEVLLKLYEKEDDEREKHKSNNEERNNKSLETVEEVDDK